MKNPNLVLALIAASFLIAGAVEPFVPNSGRPLNEAFVVHTFVIGILAFTWCKKHASARGIEAPSGSALLVGCFTLIGVPLYFFRSMPWRAALVATLKSVAFLVGVTALFQGAFVVSSTLAA